MTRIRMEFAKGDGVRFVSHLDTMKTFERAIRRAALPIAFSEGFNPHPKLSFGSALAVGVTSDGEYVDIELSRAVAAGEVMKALNASLPPGFRISKAAEVSQEAPALMAVLNRADYLVTGKITGSWSQAQMEQVILEFLQRDEAVIEKWSKKGAKEVDLRPGILNLSGGLENDTVRLEMSVMAGSEKNIRPEEVIAALVKYQNLPIDPQGVKIHRKRLYIFKDNKVLSPME
ncbi:MAG: TIGR03936 family radical SAM-associated protein [Clostridia bacterium]|nr:TIGR03936 family radical SAM-associated protein [Clostridia bacterium]